MTSATPAGCAGVVALICVALTTLTPVAADPPTVAVAPAAKPVPVIVIGVPPAVGPEVGLTAGTGGGGKAEGEWSARGVRPDPTPVGAITSTIPPAWARA